jgi:nucleotide-binding universal stress UspA family protein
MTRITQPLVVGVDGSAPSDAALLFACAEAAARRLSLAIVHAWQPFPAYASSGMMGPGPLTPAPEEMAELGQQVLAAAAKVAAEFGPSLVHEEYLIEDAPAAALLEAGEAALLVTVGGRDRTRHEPGWLGPVPLRLAAKSRCPVVVVPSDAHLGGDVVVGVDGSSLSDDAVAFAFHQASRRGTPLTAVWAYAPSAAPSGLDTGLFADRRADAQRQLSEALSGWSDKFPEVAVRHVVTDESPLLALRKESSDACLVVVGTHGRGFFLRHVLGSVSSALLRISDTAVAVVGPAGPQGSADTAG